MALDKTSLNDSISIFEEVYTLYRAIGIPLIFLFQNIWKWCLLLFWAIVFIKLWKLWYARMLICNIFLCNIKYGGGLGGYFNSPLFPSKEMQIMCKDLPFYPKQNIKILMSFFLLLNISMLNYPLSLSSGTP